MCPSTGSTWIGKRPAPWCSHHLHPQHISAAFGSAYVNDFIQGGRVKRVFVQADAPYRMLPKDLEQIYVRNTFGEDGPFSSFASGRWTFGSPRLERYNGFPSMNIWGEPSPGRSSGEAMRAMEEIVSKASPGDRLRMDRPLLSGADGQAPRRRCSTPSPSRHLPLPGGPLRELAHPDLHPGLVLPWAPSGGDGATTLRGLPNDVYFQIGLLTTLGLTTKNAILIVQFAKARWKKGWG
jgi:multidrug efflux pump subunit AcrB